MSLVVLKQVNQYANFASRVNKGKFQIITLYTGYMCCYYICANTMLSPF